MFLKICAAGLISIGYGIATAQTPTPAKAPQSAKPVTFDIVSIRENRDLPPQGGVQPFTSTPDGYRVTSMPLALVIITAFVPQHGAMFMPDQIKGLPDWAMSARYDIQAKVADKDIEAWQKPEAKDTLLPAALQAMLEERCKLVAHREMKEASVSLLVVDKDGPKFKEMNPADPPPGGMTAPGGAIVVNVNGSQQFYGATMDFFANMLTSLLGSGRRVENRTGLTGRYNIDLKSLIAARRAMSASANGAGDSDAGGSISSALGELGLKLTSSKAPVETLVIDHMEKPSEN